MPSINECCAIGSALEAWLPVVKENNESRFDAVNSFVVSVFVKYVQGETDANNFLSSVVSECALILQDAIIASQLYVQFKRFAECVSSTVTTSTRSSLLSKMSKSSSDTSGVSTQRSKLSAKTIQSASSIPTYPITIELAKQQKCSRAVLRMLAQETSDTFTSIKVDKYYPYCPTVNCHKCAVLYENVHLTKCNHQSGKKCNDLNLYPHLSRSMWRTLHGRTYLPTLVCFSRHFMNPLSCNKTYDKGQNQNTDSFLMDDDSSSLTGQGSKQQPPQIERTHNMETRSMTSMSVKAVPNATLPKRNPQQERDLESRNALVVSELDQKLAANLKLPSIRSRSERSSMTGSTVPGGQCPCGAKLVRSKKGANDMVCSIYKASHKCSDWEEIIN